MNNEKAETFRLIENPDDGTSMFRARIVKGNGLDTVVWAMFTDLGAAGAYLADLMPQPSTPQPEGEWRWAESDGWDVGPYSLEAQDGTRWEIGKGLAHPEELLRRLNALQSEVTTLRQDRDEARESLSGNLDDIVERAADGPLRFVAELRQEVSTLHAALSEAEEGLLNYRRRLRSAIYAFYPNNPLSSDDELFDAVDRLVSLHSKGEVSGD